MSQNKDSVVKDPKLMNKNVSSNNFNKLLEDKKA
jgi:hypothetical protein